MVRLFIGRRQQRAHAVLIVVVVLISLQAHAAGGHTLSAERVVFQTKHGDLEFALYPQVNLHTAGALESMQTPHQHARLTAITTSLQVAPVTSAHILKLAKVRPLPPSGGTVKHPVERRTISAHV
jgi:hypothetical protein